MIEGIQSQLWRGLRHITTNVFDIKSTAPVEGVKAVQIFGFVIDPLRVVLTSRAVDLATNLTIAVLLRVEVVQRFNSRHQRVCVVAEHRQKTGIPQEDVLVKCCINELRHKAAPRLRFMKVAKRQFPGLPVHLNVKGILVVDGFRQLVPRVSECW